MQPNHHKQVTWAIFFGMALLIGLLIANIVFQHPDLQPKGGLDELAFFCAYKFGLALSIGSGLACLCGRVAEACTADLRVLYELRAIAVILQSDPLFSTRPTSGQFRPPRLLS